jgi:LPXTG-motif cell wall-anchored protein
VDASTAVASSVPVSVLSGAVTLFDTTDQTAPIDVSIAPGITTPEVPAVPLLAGAGLLAAGATVFGRRRRRRATL